MRGAVVVLPLLVACGESTTDSVGYFGVLSGPPSYPNAFRDVLGKTERQIDAKIDDTFAVLFYGDSASQAIYFETTSDRARIYDTLHDDIRTEGMGLGMMITVQLDKQDEFDRLWRYAKTVLRYPSGAKRGYFASVCRAMEGARWSECADPFGHQQFLTALLFAGNRWGRTSGDIDYVEDAVAVLEVMRGKVAENGGATEGVTNMFDEDTKLVFDVPEETSANVTRPSIEMPAYYELWAQATRDPFWRGAADAAREHWRTAAAAETGLMPLRADFDGKPIAGSANFVPEAYRTQLNLVIDHVWFGADPWQTSVCDRQLEFFAPQGVPATSYALDGQVVEDAPETTLSIVNGVTALAATVAERKAFIQAAWDIGLREGESRYYHGILDLTALLILSGRFRVY